MEDSELWPQSSEIDVALLMNSHLSSDFRATQVSFHTLSREHNIAHKADEALLPQKQALPLQTTTLTLLLMPVAFYLLLSSTLILPVYV